MSAQALIPRSILHALKPYGIDTPGVESLTSYACRLAHSHSMAVQHLVEWVLKHFDQPLHKKHIWHLRNFSNASAASERWAGWLSALTGVGDLDRLTLTPWRHLLKTNGLSPLSDRWCPCCLAEDKATGSEPYLRLAWEIAANTVCYQHKVRLVTTCPHCRKPNVRNRAMVVVPGYCTACGGFLGDGETAPATPESLWIARQVGLMLQRRPRVGAEGVASVLRGVITRMADGHPGTFASRYGFSKAAVSQWVSNDSVPSMRLWLKVALQGGVVLEQIFSGELCAE